uniref:Rho-GAP domain-containing protein n=1 Tax=Erpetoichthys calabaricus TaxID=27687 RepID=A0A8C4SZ97_ERPCA
KKQRTTCGLNKKAASVGEATKKEDLIWHSFIKQRRGCVKSASQKNRSLTNCYWDIFPQFKKVQAHSSENKMSVQNLATVFGPNILRPKLEDPVTIMEGTSLVQHLMTVLIREHERLYISTEMEASFHNKTSSHLCNAVQSSGFLKKICKEDSSKNGKPNQTDDLCSSATSLDVNVSTPMTVSKLATQGKSEKQSHAVTSPSKQMKSLPTWKYSFRTSGGRSSSVKLGGSSVDITNLSSSGNWLMNGLSSLRGHRRTSSGERVKDSGSSQRLSTYDNVTSFKSECPSVPSTTWSTSSCEISIPDSTSSCPVCNASDCSGLNGGKAEWTMHDSQAQSDMKLSDSINCSEHSNRVTASSDSTSCAKALTILVKDLKDELGRQKVEYELRIKRNLTLAEMCAQVNRLEEELDQERKKYAMLEIKLRNSDRAREDAEKRNQLLQKEMEEFFSTLGDLTLGSRTTKYKTT